MEKNIELAIQKEEEYIQRKVYQEDNTANIYDYLAEAGYDDIEEFREDKTIYLLKHQNYIIDEVPEIKEDCYVDKIKNKIPAFVYIIHSGNNFAFVPNTFDKDDILAEYNIIPARMNYEAKNGVIITSDGDLRVVLIMPDFIEIPQNYFLIKIRDYLSKYFADVRIDNNDIMLNNKKVLGSGLKNENSMNVFMFQITFVDRSELIKKICTTSIKEPGFIDPNIVSPEQLKNEFLSWLQ